MQGYMNHEDVMETLDVGKNKAYEILNNIREESGFKNTYEAKMIGRIVIPVTIFMQFFPNAIIVMSHGGSFTQNINTE